MNNHCPEEGEFSLCKVVHIGNASYTHTRGVSAKPKTEGFRPNVGTLLKESASILIHLEMKLRALESKGIPYTTVNRYFLRVITDDLNVGLFNLKDSLTSGRGEIPKSYADAYSAIQQIPNGIDITSLFGVVDGLPNV